MVAQRLLDRVDGRGRVPAVEVLIGTQKMSEAIAAGADEPTLEALMREGEYHGMQTFDQALFAVPAPHQRPRRRRRRLGPEDLRIAMQHAGMAACTSHRQHLIPAPLEGSRACSDAAGDRGEASTVARCGGGHHAGGCGPRGLRLRRLRRADKADEAALSGGRSRPSGRRRTVPDGSRRCSRSSGGGVDGAGGTSALGVLGATTPDEAGPSSTAGRARRAAAAGVAAWELVGTIAVAAPGGSAAPRTGPAPRWCRSTASRPPGRGHRIIDVPPGQGGFLDEVLDGPSGANPPWAWPSTPSGAATGPGPGKVVGSTDAATVKAISQYRVDLGTACNLPRKVLAIHQFTEDTDRRAGAVLPRGEVAVTFHIDGFGPPDQKIRMYEAVHPPAPSPASRSSTARTRWSDP